MKKEKELKGKKPEPEIKETKEKNATRETNNMQSQQQSEAHMAGINQENLKKLEKRIAILVGIVILLILAVFIFGAVKRVFFSPIFEYKGLQVTQTRIEGINATFYVLQVPISFNNEVKLHQIFLRNDPRRLLKLEIEDDVRTKVIDPFPDQIFLTFDPDSKDLSYISLVTSQIAKVTGTSESGILQIPTSGATTSPIKGFEDSITCMHSSTTKVVIYIKFGNETSIRTDDSAKRCIILQGADRDGLIKASDKFILTMLGV